MNSSSVLGSFKGKLTVLWSSGDGGSSMSNVCFWIFHSLFCDLNALRDDHMNNPTRDVALGHVSETMSENNTRLYLAMHRNMHHKTVDY